MANNYVLKQCGKILHIFEPVYRTNYYFISGSTWIDARKFIERFFNVDLAPRRDGDKNGYFCVLRQGKTDVGVIWAEKNDTINLSHEVLHAVCWSLRDVVGLPLTSESEEAYAYLHTFLMRSIIERDIIRIT